MIERVCLFGPVQKGFDVVLDVVHHKRMLLDIVEILLQSEDCGLLETATTARQEIVSGRNLNTFGLGLDSWMENI